MRAAAPLPHASLRCRCQSSSFFLVCQLHGQCELLGSGRVGLADLYRIRCIDRAGRRVWLGSHCGLCCRNSGKERTEGRKEEAAARLQVWPGHLRDGQELTVGVVW
ncbi:hypothetical protein Mapa_015058 [Marchantia paleacea]|nr:hypothetical protein Mapa_015058 [Marchantia paleacea]